MGSDSAGARDEARHIVMEAVWSVKTTRADEIDCSAVLHSQKEVRIAKLRAALDFSRMVTEEIASELAASEKQEALG